jgi:hypothetical protein
MVDQTDTSDNNRDLMDKRREQMLDDDEISIIERVYQLWWHWADFELVVINPTIEVVLPPIVLLPEKIPENDLFEFVYPIHDHGDKLSTSKGEEMYSAGMSMCKLYYTIEKMIFLLVERLKTGGVDGETEVDLSFYGHELAQRKAFESVVNITSHKVVVTNFDPGVWGDKYLQTIKRMADKGYGYPSEAPRDTYRQAHSTSIGSKRG